MANAAPILIDFPTDQVCRIRINRPKKLNAVNYEVREAMILALPSILNDRSVRALVLGGVDGNLSAGGDVPSMEGLSEAEARARLQHIHKLCHMIWYADMPVLTAAEGIAAGGAVGLSLLGDYIYAGASTKILVPFLKLGLVPDWGMMRSLPLRIGLPRARRLILERATLKGPEALDIGLVDFCVADDDVMLATLERAAKLAELPREATATVKDRLRDQVGFEHDLANEERDQVAGLTGAEFAEGFAAYTQKRKANFLKDA